jgi:hypothetical protein
MARMRPMMGPALPAGRKIAGYSMANISRPRAACVKIKAVLKEA